MPTADAVRQRALTLAQADTRTEDAVRELLEYCEQKRVAVVLARQQFHRELEERPSDDAVKRAAELLDNVLERLPLE